MKFETKYITDHTVFVAVKEATSTTASEKLL